MVSSGYDSFKMCEIPPSAEERVLSGFKDVRSWPQLCQLVGASWDDIRARPAVKPFQLTFPSVHGRDALKSITEKQTVRLNVTVYSDGRSRPELVGSSGVDLVDRVAYALVNGSTWLPGLRYGHPVDEAVQFSLTFEHRSGGPLPGKPVQEVLSADPVHPSRLLGPPAASSPACPGLRER